MHSINPISGSADLPDPLDIDFDDDDDNPFQDLDLYDASPSQNDLSCYVLPEETIAAPAPTKPSLRRRCWQWIRHPMISFYRHRGVQQVERYAEHFGNQMLKEDGSIDRRAKEMLRKRLHEKLIEKEEHYVKEGLKYLRVYTATALVVITVVASGALVSSSIASGGQLTLPVTGGAITVAVGTALVGAGITAGLVLYRIDAIRSHNLKGIAKVGLVQYQKDKLHQREREVAELIANMAIDMAIEKNVPLFAERYTMNPHKREDIVEAVVNAMVYNEVETHYLKSWTEALAHGVEDAMKQGAGELSHVREEAREAARLEWERQPFDIEEEESALLRDEIVREVDYHVAKLWIAKVVLPPAAEVLEPYITPYLKLKDDKSYQISTRSSKIIQELSTALSGPGRSIPASVRRLDRKSKKRRRKVKKLQRQVANLEARLTALEEDREQCCTV